jgi:hypothetical protein
VKSRNPQVCLEVVVNQIHLDQFYQLFKMSQLVLIAAQTYLINNGSNYLQIHLSVFLLVL